LVLSAWSPGAVQQVPAGGEDGRHHGDEDGGDHGIDAAAGHEQRQADEQDDAAPAAGLDQDHHDWLSFRLRR
jgi:hypothetical protein